MRRGCSSTPPRTPRRRSRARAASSRRSRRVRAKWRIARPNVSPNENSPDHRGERLGRRRGDSSRPQDLCGARHLRHLGHHRAHGAEHARCHAASTSCRRNSSPRKSRRSPTTSAAMRSRQACSPRAAIVEAVAAAIEELDLPNLVVDPVMVAKGGDRLLDEDAVHALRTVSSGSRASSRPTCPKPKRSPRCRLRASSDMREAGRRILALRSAAVLVKGGHLPGDIVTDVLVDGPRRCDHRSAHPRPAHTRHGMHALRGDRGAARARRVAGQRRTWREGVCRRSDGARHRPRRRSSSTRAFLARRRSIDGMNLARRSTDVLPSQESANVRAQRTVACLRSPRWSLARYTGGGWRSPRSLRTPSTSIRSSPR